MRGIAVALLLSGCQTAEPVQPDALVCHRPTLGGGECDRSWGFVGGSTCDEQCVVKPEYDGPPCEACRTYGGTLMCADGTFEYDGRVGCCNIDNPAGGVRFYECR